MTAILQWKPTKPTTKVRSSDDPDVGLMLRVRQGDPEAFAHLVATYWIRVLGWLQSKMRNREEAEDLTQDVFLKVFRYRASYKPQAKFSTWLYHISQNVVRNALRSRRRRPSMPLVDAANKNEVQFLESLLPKESERPEQMLERKELAGQVRTAIQGLAGRQRTAVLLHQFEGQSYVEVGAALDLSPKAAKSLVYRARNRLRQALELVLEAEGN